MRKISAMYEWSGGTDYRRTCYECSRCKKLNIGKNSVYRCANYDPNNTNWNAANIACKFFNEIKVPPLVTVVKEKKRESEEAVMPGQMNIFDFLNGG